MKTTEKTWTVAEIEALFAEAHEATCAAHRLETVGPFNPYGDSYEDLTWFGSIRAAWEDEEWQRLADAVNEDRAEDEALTWEDFEANEAEILARAVEVADTVIGTGRPLVVAFCDGAYPTVFCERADEDAVQDAVAAFYPAD
jgi:hypothetical protein